MGELFGMDIISVGDPHWEPIRVGCNGNLSTLPEIYLVVYDFIKIAHGEDYAALDPLNPGYCIIKFLISDRSDNLIFGIPFLKRTHVYYSQQERYDKMCFFSY